jgi:hypothetical protein
MNSAWKAATLTRKQRTNYAWAVGIAFAVGGVLGAFCATAFRDIGLSLLCLFGYSGILSGFILLVRQLRFCPVAVKVVVWVLFPLTLMVVIMGGMVTVLPYYIYNLVRIRKTPKETFPGKPMPTPADRAKRRTALLIGVISLVIIGVVSQIIPAVQNAVAAANVYHDTGYRQDSVDNLIIREFYYSPNNPDYAQDMEYSYDIKDGVLFVLNNSDMAERKIKFPDIIGRYNVKSGAGRISNASAPFLREDLDRLFTNCCIAGDNGEYAYMLTIESYSEGEMINTRVRDNMASNPGESDTPDLREWIKSRMPWTDRTCAPPGELELFDASGEPIASKTLRDGKYVLYYGVVHRGDTQYQITASYKGENYTLLTYDDIVNFRLLSRDRKN